MFLALLQGGLAEYDDRGDCLGAATGGRRDGEGTPGSRSRRTQPDGSGTKGSKRHLQVEGRGVPLSLVVTGANRNDLSELARLLEARVAEPSASGTGAAPVPHLRADAGYAGSPALGTIVDQGYVPHVRSRHDEKVDRRTYPDYRPRRWVVEVRHPWFSRFRSLLVRFEKTHQSAVALHHLAAAIIAFRQATQLCGPYVDRQHPDWRQPPSRSGGGVQAIGGAVWWSAPSPVWGLRPGLVHGEFRPGQQGRRSV